MSQEEDGLGDDVNEILAECDALLDRAAAILEAERERALPSPPHSPFPPWSPLQALGDLLAFPPPYTPLPQPLDGSATSPGSPTSPGALSPSQAPPSPHPPASKAKVSLLCASLALVLLAFLYHPTPLKPPRVSTCHTFLCRPVNLPEVQEAAGAWAVGGWVSDPSQPPVLEQEDTIFLGTAEPFHNFSRGCGSSRERAVPLAQRWLPSPSRFPYPPWSRAATCAAIGGSNVVMVGDSLTGEFFDTLVAALAFRPEYGNTPRESRCYVRRVCSGPGERPANVYFVGVAQFLEDDAYGNEFSTPEGLPIHFDTEGGSRMDVPGDGEVAGGQTCPPPPNTDTYMKRQAWKEQLNFALTADPAPLTLTGSGGSGGSGGGGEVPPPVAAPPPPPPPIIVANTGAHYNGDGPDAVERVLSFLRYTRVLAPQALTFYRTTPRGHPNCPPFRNSPPLATPIPEAVFTEDPQVTKFWWHKFYSFTAALKPALPDYVTLLDVDYATALRMDSHPFRGRLELIGGVQDCLHYCIPGPIDHWVSLWGNLIRLARIGLNVSSSYPLYPQSRK